MNNSTDGTYTLGPIDRDVVQVYTDIGKAHEVFIKVTNVVSNLTTILTTKLDEFDFNVKNVKSEVNHIRGNVERIAGHYPSRAVYLAFLLILDIVIWILAAFLLYKVIEAYRLKHERSKKLHNKLMGHRANQPILPVYHTPTKPFKQPDISALPPSCVIIVRRPPLPPYRGGEDRSLIRRESIDLEDSLSPRQYKFYEHVV